MGCPWEPVTDLRTQTYDSHGGGSVLYSDSKQSGNLFKVDLYLLLCDNELVCVYICWDSVKGCDHFICRAILDKFDYNSFFVFFLSFYI